ncbi:unnamed protein product [Prunus armeniaca]
MKKRQVVVKQDSSGRSSSTSSSMVRTVRYGECQKNHAANLGGYAVDGCREFMASDHPIVTTPKQVQVTIRRQITRPLKTRNIFMFPEPTTTMSSSIDSQSSHIL